MKKESDSTRGHKSIRKRLTGAVLIPSVTLLAMWAIVSSYLLFDSFYVRAVVGGVREVSIPAVSAFASAQKERQLSMAYLGRPGSGLAELRMQQQQTDKGLTIMRGAVDKLIDNAPAAVVERMQKLNGLLDELPRTRDRVESREIGKSEVYAYYNSVLDAGTELFETQARVVPDVSVSQGGLTSTAIFRATDLMSRESSLVSSAFASATFTPHEHVELADLVGSYHSELDSSIPFTRTDVQEGYQRLIESDSWKRLVDAENALIGYGAWPSAPPPRSGTRVEPPVSERQWQDTTAQVNAELLKLTLANADGVSTQALEDSGAKLLNVAIGTVIALLAAVAAIVVATRVSRTLVDRALVIRLESLKKEALELAHERLPDIVRRLRQGGTVDVAEEVPELDYGQDEIGQVASAFNAAQYTAVAAAVKEAQAREGVNNVFLSIAHRNQGLVHRQLKILDKMERNEEDPGQLEGLFRLDHLATRARRNAENLIILGGEQPGRRWRKPVRLVDVLRSAISETEQYVRVRVHHIPDVAIVGSAVADTIHLVAELVDNATSFSPPRSQVLVHGTIAAKGVVVEVEDHGLGMSDDDRERANAMLADPPEFDAMALKGDSRLGLFVVARLAARLGIKVELRVSPYGGTRAIILIPMEILAADARFDSSTDMTAQLPRRDVHDSFSEPPSLAGPEHRASHRDEEIESSMFGLELNEFWSKPLSDSGGMTSRTLRNAVDSESFEVLQEAWTAEQSAFSHAKDTTDEAKPVLPHCSRAVGEDPPVVTDNSTQRPRLPRRRPQHSLAPQLRDEAAVPGPELNDDIESGRSAEEVRETMSAFQRGSREGRDADDPFES